MDEKIAFSLHECAEHGAEAGVHVVIGGDPVWSAPLTRDQLIEIRDDVSEMITEYDAAEARVKAARN